MIKISNKKFELNKFNLESKKIFFVENSARGIIVEDCKTDMKIEDYLKSKVDMTDSILRANCIVTSGKNNVEQMIKETRELYNFLIEDSSANIKNDFPEDIEIINIEKNSIRI